MIHKVYEVDPLYLLIIDSRTDSILNLLVCMLCLIYVVF